MNINYIREFLTLSEVLSYLEASELLFISISTLSKHIVKLEEELGVKLFDRSSRHMYLSEEGVIFKEFAEKIIKEYDACTSAIAANSQNSEYKLTVCFSQEVTHLGIFELLTIFKYEHPEINFEMNELKNDIINPINSILAARKCDFYFCSTYDDSPEIKSILYQRDPLVCVMWKDHPLAKHQQVTINELECENFILHKKHLETQAFMDLCSHAKITPNVLIQLSYSISIMRLVEQKIGVTVMSRQRALLHNTKSLALVNIEPEWNFDIYLLSLKRTRKSKAISTFEEFIQTHITSL